MSDSVPQDTRFPDAPGIYAILNLSNQHRYVGSAVSLLKRQQHHLHDLHTGTHKNAHLQRAFESYGADMFHFLVLELVEHVDHLLQREQYYIDTLNPKYNIARTAGSNAGMIYAPETKAKMRAARLAHPRMSEQMEKLNADRRGKKLSPEHRAKITAVQIGKKLSPEHKAKIRAAHLGKKKSPEHAENIRAGKRGHTTSPETRAKISASKRGMKHSPKTKARMSETRLGKKRPPEVGAKVSATKRAQAFAQQLPLF